MFRIVSAFWRKSLLHFKRVYEEKGKTDSQLLQILTPLQLDDAGAVCTAMIKLRLKDESLPVDGLIQNYFDFIINKEYRLADGTFAVIVLSGILFGWMICLWAFRW